MKSAFSVFSFVAALSLSGVSASAAEKSVSVDAVPVTAVAVKRGATSSEIVLPATLQAFQDTGIFARTGGYLAKWNAELGDHVKSGQVLAIVEAPELDQELASTRAKHQQAQANLELARSSATRWKELGQQNAVAQQEVEEKQAAFAARQADLAASEAEVSRLTQLKSYQSITAPFDGVITARNTNVGMLVTASSGRELYHLAQTDPLRVYLGVAQNHVRSITPGLNADVTITEFPGKTFAGKVVRLSGALDPASRTLLTEVQIPNPDGLLLPGMFAQVRFKLNSSTPALIVPSTALQIGTAGASVAVIDAGNRVRWQKVKIGRDFGATVEITEGVKEGDRLVAPTSDAIFDGQVVAPVAPPAAKK